MQQSLESPPPKPFSPAHDLLRRSARQKDEEIEQRLRPKPPPLPRALPPDVDAQVDSILATRGIVSKIAREQVADRDLSRLMPSQWLNDEIINFYGQMILSRSEDSKENPGANGVAGGKKKPLNVHYFSTFFWTKMRGEGYERSRLAKWTKKFDIFSKDIILIPVNHNNSHWTAAAINFRRKRIESFDSMNLDRQQVFKTLRQYIDLEHRNKKKQPFDFTGWEDYDPEDTPQQENGYDCGVFTCQFLESLSRGEEFFNFTQKDMPYLRRRMIWEIGNAKFLDGR
ncbi:cysteine proteinase [Leucogyrophana mollusca]|uniref:Cysteine proteinase n=1 Tax=Leucogyrophana mollusca TaxID=85980 RepID=A0ACB8B0Y9_9AGAM|nr:cysteine proteinase [Leucogyrophana mollusca]